MQGTSMQPETKFKNKVNAILNKIPGLWFVKVQQKSIAGTPDIIMCANGRFIAWELKVGSNKASPLQQYNIDSIHEAKGVAVVVTPDNLHEHLEELYVILKTDKASQ